MARKRLGTDKDVERLAETARAQKWTVTHTRNNHIQFISPNKKVPKVIFSLTSSDYRAIKNLRSNLRRSGLKNV